MDYMFISLHGLRLHPVHDEAPLQGQDLLQPQIVHVRVDIALHQRPSIIVLDESHPPEDEADG